MDDLVILLKHLGNPVDCEKYNVISFRHMPCTIATNNKVTISSCLFPQCGGNANKDCARSQPVTRCCADPGQFREGPTVRPMQFTARDPYL